MMTYKSLKKSLSVLESLTLTTFRPPSFLDRISLGAIYRNSLPEIYQPKSCENFGLFSQANTFTSWHVDFSHTSVFYQLIRGKKEFYICERTENNVKVLRNFAARFHRTLVFSVTFFVTLRLSYFIV